MVARQVLSGGQIDAPMFVKGPIRLSASILGAGNGFLRWVAGAADKTGKGRSGWEGKLL